MKRNTILTLVIGLVISIGAFSLWRVGAATVIDKGYDVFDTPNNAVTHEDITLPGGLFTVSSSNPSKEFSGTITFKGGDEVPGFIGDTVIERTKDVSVPGDTPLTLFGLRLVSAAPISVTFSDGSTVNYDVSVKESSLSASTGTMHFEGDGTYSNTLLVNREYTFTSPGRTPVVFDSAAGGMSPISLASSGTWSLGSGAAPIDSSAVAPSHGVVIIRPNTHAAIIAQHAINIANPNPHPTPTPTATPHPTIGPTKKPISTFPSNPVPIGDKGNN